MTPKDEKTLYDTLESLSSGTDVLPSDEEYLLEEILAEYGAGRGQKILRECGGKSNGPGKPAIRRHRKLRNIHCRWGQRNRLHPC